MVDPGSHRISSVPWYSGTCSQPLSISPTGVSPSLLQLPSWVRLSTLVYFVARPTTNMEIAHHEFGLFPFRSHYWGNLIRFLFLQVLRYFNSLRSLPFRDGHKTEFPHSEIHGSKAVRHLTVAYRSHTTSFIASYCQGIHRIPLAA